MKSFFLVLVALSAVTAKNLCTPDAFFKINCSTCVCSNDGKSAACTDMTCPSKENQNVNDMKYIEIHQHCEPKSIFSPDNCNVCRCSKDGIKMICTTKVCQNEEVKLLKSINCDPRSIFSTDNCNTCRCSIGGTKAVCTMKSCSDAEEPKKICQPNFQFKDYCNACICSPDGTSFLCTKMNCDKDMWNKNGSLKVMQAKDVVAQDEKQICTPNSQFKEQCNACLCSEDGLSKFCTSMNCNIAQTSGPGEVYSPYGCQPCTCNCKCPV